MQGLKNILNSAVVLTVLILGFSNPASAQELPGPVKAMDRNEQALNQLPANVRKNLTPGVRYTVGYQTTTGWEKSLTKANHNLGHYYWAPMTNMIQATPSQRTGSQSVRVAPPKKKDFHYIKPTKAALPVNPAAVYVAPPQPKADYAMARHLPPMKNTRIKDVSATLSYRKPSKHNENVSGQLVSKQTKAAVYASYPSSGASAQAAGDLTSKDVHGNIVSK